MPRAISAASGLVVLALLSPAAALAAFPSTDEIAAVAEAHGLTCTQPDGADDGGAHVSCERDAADPTLTNIDVSVTYNVASFETGSGFATVATYIDPPPADWLDLATGIASLFCEGAADAVAEAVASEPDATELDGCRITTSADAFIHMVDVQPAVEPPSNGIGEWSAAGASTYSGMWTLVHFEADTDSLGEGTVGDSLPGTVEVDCTHGGGRCNYTLTRDGEPWAATALEVVEVGQLHGVDEAELDNCEDGQLTRTAHDATYGPSDASASFERATVPRTCSEGTSTLYAADSTWTFEGSLTAFRPPPARDLERYLLGYGFACADAALGTTECTLEAADGGGLGATYRVVTRRDDAGQVIGIDASALSRDESMPSDAGGFLRSVAELSPVDNGAALLAWFDGALLGDGTEYADGSWTAAWTDETAGEGRRWGLSIVSAAAPSPAPTEGAPPLPDGPAAAPGARADRTFAESLPTVAQVSTDPAVLLQSAALAALLVFLMPFPSQLFNSTLETHEDEVKRWFRLDRLGRSAAGVGAFWASWPGIAVFTLLAALLFSALDPGFGLDIGSLATFAGMLVGIVLVTAAFAVPAVVAHRGAGDRPSLKVVPISLLIGVGCVLLSRLTGFQPGYLYGLLIGLAFARELSEAEEGRTAAIGAALMLAAAFVCWVALGAVPEGDGFGLVVLRTSLAALTVAGLEGVVFGLLPMRFLPGESIYAWNRPLWAGLLAIGGFAFFHILINPASGYLSDTSRTPLFTVIALLVGFSLLSVAFWAWFRFRSVATQPTS